MTPDLPIPAVQPIDSPLMVHSLYNLLIFNLLIPVFVLLPQPDLPLIAHLSIQLPRNAGIQQRQQPMMLLLYALMQLDFAYFANL